MPITIFLLQQLFIQCDNKTIDLIKFNKRIKMHINKKNSAIKALKVCTKVIS